MMMMMSAGQLIALPAAVLHGQILLGAVLQPPLPRCQPSVGAQRQACLLPAHGRHPQEPGVPPRGPAEVPLPCGACRAAGGGPCVPLRAGSRGARLPSQALPPLGN